MDSNEPPHLATASTTKGVPLAPSMGPALAAEHVRHTLPLVDKRLLFICATALVIAAATSVVALVLIKLISLITNLAFFQKFSIEATSPADNHLGGLVLVIPVIGGIIVGLMARYGSKAIRGHGIPEAMEQVLANESVIPARITFLKPVSAAISIGTGGPFGAEGPIIASGGALGSLVGQILKTTAQERKTLLASGAAAGMTAIFGSPISAVLLAVELLVFEYRPRSFIPLALSTAVAGTFRILLFGSAPAFAMPHVEPSSFSGIGAYFIEGAFLGVASVLVTKLVYGVEDAFEKLPIHWMWWPALGGVVVGVVGYISPHTLGVGYDNIDRLLTGTLPLAVAGSFCFWKFVSWCLSLGSGTSGGTLAPLFTIGGGIGLIFAQLVAPLFPAGAINPSVAALVGMASMFSGASRAMMASIVFAFETTKEPFAILPLLAGGTAAYLVSCFRMKHSIMTEKIARRGVHIPTELHADPLSHFSVRNVATGSPTCFPSSTTLEEVRKRLNSAHPDYQHQGYPVVDGSQKPIGVFTRRDLMKAQDTQKKTVGELMTGRIVKIGESALLSDARTLMIAEDVGRLLVIREEDGRLSGILTRSDLLRAYSKNLSANATQVAKLDLKKNLLSYLPRR